MKQVNVNFKVDGQKVKTENAIPTEISELNDDIGIIDSGTFESALNRKQDILISGENIKTINGNDITGPGNIELDIDKSDLVTINTDQTITGAKTFNSSVTFNGITTFNGTSNFSTIKADYYDTSSSTLYFRTNGTNRFTMTSSAFRPYSTNQYDLGAINYKFRNLYLNGNLTDGSNSITVSNIVSGINSISNKQDKLTAGEGITIENNTISSTAGVNIRRV